jgi:hypothetical protein
MARRRTRNGNGNGYHANGHWQIDRRVPMAFVLTMFLQTVGVVWWASGVHSELAGHRSAIASLQAKSDQIAVIQTDIRHMTKTLEKVVEKVEMALSRPNGRPLVR